MADHSVCLKEGQTAVRKRSAQQVEEAKEVTIAGEPVQGARQLWRVTKTGAWLMVQLSTVIGTELDAQE